LYIYDNAALTSLPELSGLTNLIALEISYAGLTSLPELSGLTNLTELYIGNNAALTSLPELSGLTNLTELYIGNNAGLQCVGGYPEQLTIQEEWPPVCEE
jgi:Leucine-rich repeat (LRR) protein